MPKIYQLLTDSADGMNLETFATEAARDAAATAAVKPWWDDKFPGSEMPEWEEASQGLACGVGFDTYWYWFDTEVPEAPAKPTTPGGKWRESGEADPHADRYAVERAQLCMGHLSDDELANGAFMNYDQPLHLQGIAVGTHYSPIAWMTAVKDRIRWLSRKLAEATNT